MFSHAAVASLNNLEMMVYHYVIKNRDKVMYMIISLSLERARRSGAVTSYAEARVSLHNAIILLEMLTNVKIIKGK